MIYSCEVKKLLRFLEKWKKNLFTLNSPRMLKHKLCTRFFKIQFCISMDIYLLSIVEYLFSAVNNNLFFLDM